MNEDVYFVGAGVSLNSPTNIPTGYAIISELVKTLSPSKHYRKALLELANSSRKSKKNPHDYIRFELLFEVIRTYVDEKLDILRFIDQFETPNLLHYSLAEKAINNSFVITTNFDCLIEQAILRLGAQPISICYNTDFRNWESYRNDGFVPVFKIHGSFRRYNGHQYKTASSTIEATLDKITSNVRHLSLSKFKNDFLARITAKRTIIIGGYSGSDDFDIIPTFKQLHFKKMIWLEHNSEAIICDVTEMTLNELIKIPREQLSQKEEMFIELKNKINILEVNTQTYFEELIVNREIISKSSSGDNVKFNFSKYVKLWGKGYLNLESKYACAAELFRRLNRKTAAYNCAKAALIHSPIEGIPKYQILISSILVAIGKPEEILKASNLLADILNRLKNEKNRTEFSEALHLVGFIESKKGKFSDAIKFFDHSIRNAVKYRHRIIASNSYHDKALVLTDLGQLIDANVLFRKSIKQSSLSGDIKHVSWSYYHLACNYFDLGKLTLAVRNLRRGLEISRLLSDYAHLSNLHHLLGQIDHLRGQNDTAMNHLETSLEYDQIISNTEYSSMTWQQLGVVKLELKQYKQAEKCFERSHELYNSHVDKYGLIELLCYWCWLNIETGNKKLAFQNIELAEKMLLSSRHNQYGLRVMMLKSILDASISKSYSFTKIEQAIKASKFKLMLYDMIYLASRLGLSIDSISNESIKEAKKFYSKVENSLKLYVLKK